jgi:hypothetical protein
LIPIRDVPTEAPLVVRPSLLGSAGFQARLHHALPKRAPVAIIRAVLARGLRAEASEFPDRPLPQRSRGSAIARRLGGAPPAASTSPEQRERSVHRAASIRPASAAEARRALHEQGWTESLDRLQQLISAQGSARAGAYT